MPSEDTLSKLLSSASLVFVGSFIGSASRLVERVIIAGALSPAAYGEVSIGLVIVNLGLFVSVLGFNHGVPRYMSRFDDSREVRGAWASGLTVATVASLLVVGVVLANVDLVVGLLFEREGSTRLVTLFVLSLPFAVGLRIGVSAIQGHENTIFRTYAQDLFYPGVRLGLLVGLLWAGAGIFAAGYAYLLASAAAFVFVHLLLNRLTPLFGRIRTNLREMTAFSIPLMFSTLLAVLLTNTDTLMLGALRPSAQVGLYSAAFPLANGMSVALTAFGYLYLPLASRLDAEGERDEIDAIYKISTKWVFVITFPAFLALVVFPGDTLAIVFGPEYRRAWPALVILAVGFFTHATGGRNRETVTALGDTNYVLAVNGAVFVLNVALNLLLIPPLGLVGAAVASASSYATMNVMFLALLKVKFGITPFSRWSIRTFIVLPATLVPPALVASRWVTLQALTLPVFLVVAGLASLFVVAVTGCLQPNDAVPLEFLEDRLGVRVPIVRRFLPEAEGTVGGG